MANTSKPQGFIPSRYLDGSAWNGATNMYYIASAEANQINVGDAVKSSAVSDANGVMGVTKITNGTDTVRGVVVGFFVAPPYGVSSQGVNLDLTLQNIPATKTKAYYASVVDDPNVLYEIQDDGTALAATAVNKNASFTVTNPTSPQQNSASVLTAASVATTQGLNLRIMGAIQRDDNTPFIANAKYLVKFNQHELMGNTAGI